MLKFTLIFSSLFFTINAFSFNSESREEYPKYDCSITLYVGALNQPGEINFEYDSLMGKVYKRLADHRIEISLDKNSMSEIMFTRDGESRYNGGTRISGGTRVISTMTGIDNGKSILVLCEQK